MSFVKYEQQGPVAILTIDRAEALNALNSQVLSDLDEAISKVELLKSICMLISRGALISMVVILLVLPAGLMLLDGLICRTTYHWLNAPNAAKE